MDLFYFVSSGEQRIFLVPSDCQLFLMGSKKIDIRLRIRCNEGGIVLEIFYILSGYNIRYQFNLSYSEFLDEYIRPEFLSK